MKFTNVPYKYTIDGQKLKIDKEGDYNGIPETCPECECVQSKNYKDFTNNNVQICTQCNTEIYLSTYR